MSNSNDDDFGLHMFLFPFMAHGHMIPISDMAKLFASHNVTITIITTPLNALRFSQTTLPLSSHIHVIPIHFPTDQVGLPSGLENLDTLPSPDLVLPFFRATRLLQPQLENLLERSKPTCIIADMFFPWVTDSAAKFGIPRLVFNGTGFFAMCCAACVGMHKPHEGVASDDEVFVIPGLPGGIEMTRGQLPDFIKSNVLGEVTLLMKEAVEVEARSFGTVMNSFCELEEVYVEYYRNVMGRRSWHIGPVSLCNKESEDKVNRGKEVTIDQHECLRWLDSKNADSVVYVCFGSVADFNDAQLKEIALALGDVGVDFVWVVRRGKDEEGDDWLPEGFEERNKGKGLIIRGWSPQVLILDHPSVGGFVTHCGWNSTLEGISAGLPMVTWPVSAEQFYNEKLVTQVLRNGVRVGAQKWVRLFGDSVNKEAIARAVREIMVGEEAEERRRRTRELGKQARRAVEEGGSSYLDFKKLIQELKAHQLG